MRATGKVAIVTGSARGFGLEIAQQSAALGFEIDALLVCCGGGGLMLFYEPEEETRMGVLRVEMAVEAGADVIVTACPFCLVNMEDAIKVAGLEGKLEAIELAELVAMHIQ